MNETEEIMYALIISKNQVRRKGKEAGNWEKNRDNEGRVLKKIDRCLEGKKEKIKQGEKEGRREDDEWKE